MTAMRRTILPIIAFVLLCATSFASESDPTVRTEVSGRVALDTVWSGNVVVTGDVFVPASVTLKIRPGTIVTFRRTDSTKVEPESFLGGNELIVRGYLVAEGVEFRFDDRTGGVVVDGGTTKLVDLKVDGAEVGLMAVNGGVLNAVGPVSVTDCRIGTALFPGSSWSGKGIVKLTKNGVGAVRLPGASVLPATIKPEKNEEGDVLSWDAPVPASVVTGLDLVAPKAGASRLGDTFVDSDMTLSGDVIVSGTVRVAPGATLTILPGTRIFFTFVDTDGNGIGENGLFLQGRLVARGEKERPIVLLPINVAGIAKWDSVNFMASEAEGNVMSHVRIVGAYRGVHAHFSKVSISDVTVERTMRGFQFQESDVEMARIATRGCASALRARDCDIRVAGFDAVNGLSGMNIFRSRLTLSQASFVRTGLYGLRLRDSRSVVTGLSGSSSFVPLSVQEGSATLTDVSIDDAGLAGISFLDGESTVVGSKVTGSRLDAVSAGSGKVSWRGGSLSGFGRYAVKLTGPAAVTLSGVAAAPVFDGSSKQGLGTVSFEK